MIENGFPKGNNGKSMVSTLGYVDNTRRVNALLREGMQLRQFRSQLSNAEQKELDKRVPDIEPTVGYAYDKIESIEAVEASVRDLEAKYKKSQEDLLARRQKALEAQAEKVKAEEEALKAKFLEFQRSLESGKSG